MLGRLAWIAGLLVLASCGARTDMGGVEEEEVDGSVLDAAPPDSTLPDVTVDVSPPPPPPDDVQPPPPPPPPDDAEPPPPPPECNITCTHNHDCEQQCPDIGPNERWCCDELVETCYAFAGKKCPGIIIDAGFD